MYVDFGHLYFFIYSFQDLDNKEKRSFERVEILVHVMLKTYQSQLFSSKIISSLWSTVGGVPFLPA